MAEEDVSAQNELMLQVDNEGFVVGHWYDPNFVLEKTGTFAYPTTCLNHHLARNRLAKRRRNHLKRKRNRFNRRLIRRWGDKLTIYEDEQATRCSSAFKVGSCHNLVREVVRRMDDSSKQNAALVCRAWAIEVRAVSPHPKFEAAMWENAMTYCSNAYTASVIRGQDGGLRTLRYECACKRWNSSIHYSNFVNWSLVDPEDNKFDKYLKDEIGLLESIANRE